MRVPVCLRGRVDAPRKNYFKVKTFDSSMVEKKEPETFEECCICLENQVSSREKTRCGHSVCEGCLDQMQQAVCPMCRGPIGLTKKALERIAEKENYKKKLANYARLFAPRYPILYCVFEIEH